MSGQAQVSGRRHMTTVNVKLTDDMRRFLEQQGARHGVHALDEVIANHLIRWQEKETVRRKLEVLIQEGIDSPSLPVTEDRWLEEEKRFVKRHPGVNAE